MGNSQFNSVKDGADGSGRDDGPYSTLYAETRTTPGPSGFAPALRVENNNRSAYTADTSVMTAGGVVGGGEGFGGNGSGRTGGGGGRGGGGGGGGDGGMAGDDMDVESKMDEEEEVRVCFDPQHQSFETCFVCC